MNDEAVALDAPIVPQVPKPVLIPTWAPGVDVRMTFGKYRGQVGWIVGWLVSPNPDDRHGGWQVFLPKVGDSIVTLPAHFERVKHLPKWAALPELMPDYVAPRPAPTRSAIPLTEQEERKRERDRIRKQLARLQAKARKDGAA